MLDFIRNFKFCSNIGILKLLYFSLVHSELEYGSLIWDPFYPTNSSSLEFEFSLKKATRSRRRRKSSPTVSLTIFSTYYCQTNPRPTHVLNVVFQAIVNSLRLPLHFLYTLINHFY